jgi:glutamine---fructose-6-phosphate transaminase (isomerizing)
MIHEKDLFNVRSRRRRLPGGEHGDFRSAMEDTNKEPNWIAGIEPPAEMRTMSMTEIYERECREQPQRLADLLQAYSEDESILAEMDKLRHMALAPEPILFIGMGASYCSSLAGSVCMQSRGRSSFFADAGEWLHYARSVWDEVALSILTTASGESAELVQLCRQERAKPLALVCNNPKSICWSLAQERLPLLAGPEYGNATKTYTNATAASIVLASHITGHSWKMDATQMREAYSKSLDHAFSVCSELAQFCEGAANIELVGRGPAYGAAIMGALCIREMAGKRAAAHSGAGFRHGPLLDVNETHVAIILALGHTSQLGVKLAQDCIARKGKVILISAEEHQATEKLLPVKLTAVPEPWEALTAVLVPQALTLGMIEKHGANLRPRFEYGIMKE